MPVPSPRWLLYRLVDPTSPAEDAVLHVGVHPELTGRRTGLVDFAWLASGEDLRASAPAVYTRVDALFNQGMPPRVEVVSDHGTWGEAPAELAERLQDEVVGADGVEPSFQGKRGFVYSGDTLDRIVFARQGALPDAMDTVTVALHDYGDFDSPEELLQTEPAELFERLKPQFGRDLVASLRTRSDDFPALLAAVAGAGFARGMIPPGFVLGVWQVRGTAQNTDFEAIETELVKAVRPGLIGTVLRHGTRVLWHKPPTTPDREQAGSV